MLSFPCVLSLVVLALIAPSSTQQPPSQPSDVRVMTFNIRYGTANDGENHWEKRKDFLIETIKAFDPDLLGTQETLGFQRDYLAEKLKLYDVLGVGRDDGREAGEMAALYFKRSRFEKLDGGHFWLSETPDQAGSKSWGHIAYANGHLGQNSGSASAPRQANRLPQYALRSSRPAGSSGIGSADSSSCSGIERGRPSRCNGRFQYRRRQ